MIPPCDLCNQPARGAIAYVNGLRVCEVCYWTVAFGLTIVEAMTPEPKETPCTSS